MALLGEGREHLWIGAILVMPCAFHRIEALRIEIGHTHFVARRLKVGARYFAEAAVERAGLGMREDE